MEGFLGKGLSQNLSGEGSRTVRSGLQAPFLWETSFPTALPLSAASQRGAGLSFFFWETGLLSDPPFRVNRSIIAKNRGYQL